MTDAERDTALRLKMYLGLLGAGDHTNVGVGRADHKGQRVPALHVYITPTDDRRVATRFTRFDGMPVLWHVSGPARPLALG